MDIIITLPKHLWYKISGGEKTLELRKNYPKNFDIKKDRVYVCVKGTHKCYGYFRVSWFQYCRNNLDFILSKESRIQVPAEWIKKYLEGSIIAYLWHIKYAIAFELPIDINAGYNVTRAPQNFCYV